MRLIDTHSHLDFGVFEEELASLAERSRKKGLSGFVVPGVVQAGWQRILDICREFSDFYAAPGLHPCFTAEHRPADLEKLREILEDGEEKIIAIGEIGLDYFIKSADRQQQMTYFKEQIRIARTARLPLLLHVRKAHDEVLQVIRRLNFNHGGIVHCYSGSLQQAERYIDRGFKLGIGGVITYTNANRLQSIAQSLPLTAFVLETDAPDIPLEGRQGELNTPENLPEICNAFSQHRSEPLEQVADTLLQNTLDLFPQLEN